ncbi:unnamed protein product [Clavelina lepadiformis]|uniref:TsaA-like domain-containing protein n=1 Tax=Clavelina lepadiformis TaxID=159417 RepID=A0ABP0FY97_CLALP
MEHSIEGLAEFSHLWIIFVFHLNGHKSTKAKVKPPRLNGQKTGVFSTRTPHRPNAIGLTLAKIDSVEGDTIRLSGLDIVDGTPILDIKPYISVYDKPQIRPTTTQHLNMDGYFSNETNNFQDPRQHKSSETSIKTSDNSQKTVAASINETLNEVSPTTDAECHELSTDVESAEWIEKPPISDLTVLFTNRAEHNINNFQSSVRSEIEIKSEFMALTDWHLEHIEPCDLRGVITDILKADPRSTYRRNKCSDRLYYFTIDNAHVTAWFDDTVVPNYVEVVRVIPKKHVKSMPLS